jgi:DNA-binding transcriptional ArsR family regulator
MAAVVEDELSLVFSALADPTRRAILERLARGDATETRTAQSRPCVLETVRLDAAVGWIARHRQIWAGRHDRLEEHLAGLRRRDEGTTR